MFGQTDAEGPLGWCAQEKNGFPVNYSVSLVGLTGSICWQGINMQMGVICKRVG